MTHLFLSVLNKMSGSIRVGQARRAHSYPSAEGFTQIAAWSRGKLPYTNLSPFLLGPLLVDGLQSQNFENAWQYSKCYEEHLTNDEPNERWQQWRASGFANSEAQRRPMGREIPKFCYLQGNKLNIVDARRNLYAPEYKKLARKTQAYADLLDRLRRGENLLIIGPDGPSVEDFPQGVPVTKELLRQLISITDQKAFYNLLGMTHTGDNRYFPFGHEYVLAEALLEDLDPGSLRIGDTAIISYQNYQYQTKIIDMQGPTILLEILTPMVGIQEVRRTTVTWGDNKWTLFGGETVSVQFSRAN